MMSQDELAQVLSCGIEGLKLLDFVFFGGAVRRRHAGGWRVG